MSSNPRLMTLRSARPALAGLVLLAAFGCGGSHGKGTVSGTVTLDGQPLPAGKIAFVPAQGAGVSADIKEDGTYTATDVPAGEIKVIVETASLKPIVDQAKGAGAKGGPAKYASGSSGGPGATTTPDANMSPEAKAFFEKQQKTVAEGRERAKELAARYRAIPTKYADPGTSGLSLTVKSGENKYDVPLSSK
jgi:hypothetical protein